MTRNRKRQFAINTASGFVNQIVAVVVGFVSLPYILHQLGPEVYGISRLAQSALVFFGILQLGMGPTLIRFCSQAIAQNDRETMHRISSSAQAILGSLGLIGMAGIIGFIPVFLYMYKVPADLTFDVSVLLCCMAISFLLNFVSLIPHGFTLGSNRYDLINGISAIAVALRLGLIILTFELFEPSILLLGICMLAMQAFRFVAFFTVAFLSVGRVVLFSVRAVSQKTVKAICGFSLLNLTNALASALVLQCPILIIGYMIDSEAVTFYSPAILIASLLLSFLGQIASPLVPLASQARTEGKPEKLGEWSIKIGSFVACAGLGMVLPLCIFGHELVRFWLGQDMAWTWKIVTVVSVGSILPASVGVNYHLALGGGNIFPTVSSHVVLGIVSSLGTFIGLGWLNWDLMGVAIFLVFCTCIRSAFYLVYAYSRQFGYRVWDYWRIVYLRSWSVFLVAVGVGVLIRFSLSPTTNIILVSEIMLVSMVYAILAWFFVIPEEIKHYAKQKIASLKSSTGNYKSLLEIQNLKRLLRRTKNFLLRWLYRPPVLLIRLLLSVLFRACGIFRTHRKILLAYSSYVTVKYLNGYYECLKDDKRLVFYATVRRIDDNDYDRIMENIPKGVKILRWPAMMHLWDMIIVSDLYLPKYITKHQSPAIHIGHGIPALILENDTKPYPYGMYAVKNGKYLFSRNHVGNSLETANPFGLEKGTIKWVGNLDLEILHDEVEKRDTHRNALGLAPDDTMVFMISSWRKKSLFGVLGTSILDEAKKLQGKYRFALSVHPNEYYDQEDTGTSFGAYIDSMTEQGFLVRRPWDNWVPYMVSADIVVADFTSFICPAIWLRKPIVLSPYSLDEFWDLSLQYKLAKLAPIIEQSSQLPQKLDEVSAYYPCDEYEEIVRQIYLPKGEPQERIKNDLYGILKLKHTTAT